MSPKTVLVLGAGIGGTVAATRLRRALPREHRVILVEREAARPFQPSLLWVMTGDRNLEAISRPVSRLARRGIELLQGKVEAIDPQTRRVTVAGREIDADHMIVALGAELVSEAIPGLAEAGNNLYTVEGAQALRQALPAFRQGRLAVLVAGIPFKCPAAPYEAAMLLEAWLRRGGVRDRVEVDLYTPEPGPMPSAGPEVSAQLRRMLESKHIRLHTEHVVTHADATSRVLHFADGSSAPFVLLAYVPPHRASAVVREAGLTGESGWVAVDRHTLETGHPGVYALGDVTAIPLSMGKPLPKAGVFAHRQAEVVATNIASAILGRARRGAFDGLGECFIETGDGRAGFGRGNFYAEPRPEVRLRPPSVLLPMSSTGCTAGSEAIPFGLSTLKNCRRFCRGRTLLFSIEGDHNEEIHPFRLVAFLGIHAARPCRRGAGCAASPGPVGSQGGVGHQPGRPEKAPAQFPGDPPDLRGSGALERASRHGVRVPRPGGEAHFQRTWPVVAGGR
jgi:sulfide:quinone oxidoreductase